MNWDAIGAIGEIVGAVAVVVSLIYLAIQVRGNSQNLERTVQATRTQNSQSVYENFNEWRQMVLAPDGAEIWRKGINDLNSLDQDEKVRFGMIASSFSWSCWYMYQMQHNEGLMADVSSNVWQDLFMHPGFREWHLEHRRLHSDDYGEFLDRVCEAVGDKRYNHGELSSLMPMNY